MKTFIKSKKFIVGISIVTALIILMLIFLPIIKSNYVTLKVEDIKINNDMMSYLVNDELNDYIEYHTNSVGDNYLNTVGLNKDKNLRKQKSVYGGSWYEYFYELAEKRAKEILLVCKAASKSNIGLNKNEQKEIDTLISEFEIGKLKISENNLRTIITYEKIAEKYKNKFLSTLKDSDYDSYYNDNRKDFDCIDYKCVVVEVDVEQNVTENQSIEDLTSKASKRVDKLKEDIINEGFDKPVSEYLNEIGSEQKLEDLTFTSQRYISGVQFVEWAFDEQRKAGDVVVFAGNYQFSIYYLEKTPYPYDYNLVDGIVAYGDYDSSNPRAITELKEKLEEKVQNDSDLMKFISDNNFKTMNLYKEDLPSHVCQWFYSVDKKVGDIEVCIYGENIYIMKYNGQGDSYFKESLKSKCQEYKYDLHIEELSKTITIKD